MKHLLKNLIRAESTSRKGELDAAEVLRDYFAAHGLTARIDAWDGGRANLVLHVPSSGRRKGLLFASHLDVVPADAKGWSHHPFRPYEQEGRIYGRGACDMKGGLAAAAVAVVELVEEGMKFDGDCIFAATAGEETDSAGARRFTQEYIQALPDLAGVVIPEPTDFAMITAHRGILWVKIRTLGRTAHGSMPHLGVNAIHLMRPILDKLDRFTVQGPEHARLGRCGFSVNQIHGGDAFNVIPDLCEVCLDIRTVPGAEHEMILAQLCEVVEQAKAECEGEEFRYELEVCRDVPAMQTDEDDDFVKGFAVLAGISEFTSVGYTTDGPHFTLFKAPIVIFGPGKSQTCHKPDEYIDFSDMKRAKNIYKKLIGQCLG